MIQHKLCSECLISLVNFSILSSLVYVSDLVKIISDGKVFFYNFLLVLTVSVSNYFATIEVAYLSWYTEIEWYFVWEIIIDMNQCAYPKKSTWNIFPKVSTNHFPRSSFVYQ